MPLLTKEHKLVLDKIQKTLRGATIARSESPGDFNAVKAYLDAMANIANYMQTASHSPFKYCLGHIEHQTNLVESLSLVEEIQLYLYPPAFKAFILEEMSKEPRIIDLSAHINHNHCINFFQKETKTLTYKIIFSDNDKIEWIQPCTEEKLMDIERQFNEKMHSLRHEDLLVRL